jgi:hypothetical protein
MAEFKKGEKAKIAIDDCVGYPLSSEDTRWGFVTVMDQIDHVVLVLPHWSGHEQIYKVTHLHKL